ncbi:MAG: hypothetical protein K6G47_13380 [Clostridia bacterium]|nr:hypothetical protein [Clostridia bacterium]
MSESKARFITRRVIGLIFGILHIFAAILCVIYSTYQMNENNKPIVPIEQAQEGDHVKVTLVRNLDTLETNVTKHRRRGGMTTTKRYCYYLIEIKEGNNGCIIVHSEASDKWEDPDNFPRVYEGVINGTFNDDIIEKADVSAGVYNKPLYDGRIELTNVYIRNYIVAGVLFVIGLIALVIVLIPRKIRE